MKKVSIIIPVYNAELYLKVTIESILQQTYSNIEIIIVDDSSTDKSLEIAHSFERDNVKVIQQKNAGAAVARNTGFSHSNGDYIQFMDADDYLSYDKIEKQVAALDVATGKIAVCNYEQFTTEADMLIEKDTTYQNDFIFSADDPANFLINLYGGNGPYNFIQTNCWLVPRDIINCSGVWRCYRCPNDDGEFFARVLMASKGIVHVPIIRNYYRKPVTTATLSSNNNYKYVQNTLLTIDLKASYLAAHSGLNTFKRAFATQYFEYAVYNYPKYMLLSKIAEKRFRSFNIDVPIPMLGGKMLTIMCKYFGWKFTRLLIYYIKESFLLKP